VVLEEREQGIVELVSGFEAGTAADVINHSSSVRCQGRPACMAIHIELATNALFCRIEAGEGRRQADGRHARLTASGQDAFDQPATMTAAPVRRRARLRR
jgi:hypothetical protein